MCRPPVRRRASRSISLGISLGVLALSLLSAPAQAQTSAELAARIAVLEDSIKATQALIRAAQVRESLALDDSVVSEGIVILFPAAALSEDDRSALREGIVRANASLAERYGSDATHLLDGEVTSINFQSRTARGYDVAVFVDGRSSSGAAGRALPMPLERGAVERYLLGRAGQRLMRRDPALQAFAGAAFSLIPNEADFYVARRQLAVSRSSVARRCAEESVSACRTLLDIRHPDGRFAPGDSVPRSNVAVPQGVHGSLVVVALELGGAKALNAIGQTDGLDEPVAILAQVAGVTPDSLLRAWGQRLSASGGTSASPSLPFTAAVVGWCGIFLLAATRRRPR